MNKDNTKECFVCLLERPRTDYIKAYKNGVIAEYNTCIACRRVFIKSKEDERQKKV